MDRLSKYFPFFIVALGFWLWAGALEAGFALDDRMYILNNPSVRTLGGTPLSDPRLIGFLSLSLNYMAGGFTPFDYHLVNVVIHLINSLLVFFILKAAFINPLRGSVQSSWSDERSVHVAFAFVAALVFMAHPVQAQAVTYLSQRFASLAALFYLFALFLFIKARILDISGDKKGATLRYFFCVLSTLFAMKTKEIAFTLPFALALFDVIFFKGMRRSMRIYIPLGLALFVIPLSLFIESSGVAGADTISKISRTKLLEASSMSSATYLFTEFSVVAHYIGLLFYPAKLRFYYDFPVSETLFNARTALSLLFLLLVALIGVFTLKRSRGSKEGEAGANPYGLVAAFGIFFFFLALAVESSVVPIKDVIFEHRLYLPSFGLISAFTAGCFYLSLRVFRGEGKRAAPVALCVLFFLVVAPLGAALKARNEVWKDPLVFINDNIEKSPDMAHLYYIRALIYIEREELPSAIADSTRAIELDPTHFLALGNRGTAYLLSGRNEEGIADLTRALELRPQHFDSYMNRAIVYVRTGRVEPALSDLKSAYKLNPAGARRTYARWIAADLAPACARPDRPRGCSIIEELEGGE